MNTLQWPAVVVIDLQTSPAMQTCGSYPRCIWALTCTDVWPKIFDLLSSGPCNFICFTSPTFVIVGVLMLSFEDSSSSSSVGVGVISANTRGHVNSCSWGSFKLQLDRRKSRRKKKTFSSACGYSVSLCSLIHVFVWNMSYPIKRTFKHNQSTLQRNQRAYW